MNATEPKTFTLTEQQLSELTGRLDALARAGISLQGADHLVAMMTLLQRVVSNAANVVDLPRDEQAA